MTQRSKLTKGIGETLKTERLKRGITIDKVSFDTKIKKEYLEAIELDDLKIFASDVQAKGFIINYAKYLEMDTSLVLAFYRRDHNIENKRSDVKKNDKPANNLKFDRKFILVPLVLVIFITLFLIVKNLSGKVFEPPLLKITSPIETSESDVEFISEENSLVIKGETSDFTLIKINEKPIPLKNGFLFESDPYPVTSEENIFIITATNRVGVETEISLRVSRQLIKDDAFAPKDAFLEIKNSNTFILVRGDGVIKFNDQTFPEDIIPVKFTNTLEIESSTPENIIVKIEDEEFQLAKALEKFLFKNDKIERE